MKKILDACYTKNLLLLLLAAGLALSFSPKAMAVDIQVSGQYKYEGWSEDRHSLKNNSTTQSNSVTFQDSMLLLNGRLKVADGLEVNSRARILDKIWGDTVEQDRAYSTTKLQRENVEFDTLYMTAKLGPGTLTVGAIPGNAAAGGTTFGAPFGSDDIPRNMILYGLGFGNWYHQIGYVKFNEKELTYAAGSPVYGTGADVDDNRWKYTMIYTRPRWDCGAEIAYHINDTNKSLATYGTRTRYYYIEPYARATFGPLFVEAKGIYLDGRIEFQSPSPFVQDRDLQGYNLYAHARYTYGPAYLGGAFLYVMGEDPGTTNKQEAIGTSGRDLHMALILVNPDRDKYMGPLGMGGSAQPLGDTYVNNGATNLQMSQAYFGLNPMEKLGIQVTYNHAEMDRKPTGYLSTKLGDEVDVTGNYKINDNLSYTVGFGYLWAGDAWKGTDANTQVSNDWLIMHKLTLTF